MNHLPLMARFNQWVNERVYETVARLDDADYRRDLGAFFGSIHNTLNHLLVVDRLWSGRIRGVDSGITSLRQILYDDFDELREARAAEDVRLIELVDSLSETQLGRPVVYRRMIGNGEEEARAGHILITLFNHQTHHRGQVHAMLTRCGITPPDLDVIFFLDEIGESG
ncbi:MAG: DinB family protein, partial [Gammaproteobacteria bacterium]|nr:DinB family protein [Gammaproteobacteria bacterium]